MRKRPRGPNESLRKRARAVLESLTPAERVALRERLESYFSVTRDSVLEDIGQAFEKTRERIREIERRALRKLEERDKGSPKAPEGRGLPIKPWVFPKPPQSASSSQGDASRAGPGNKRRSKRGDKPKRPRRSGRGKGRGRRDR